MGKFAIRLVIDGPQIESSCLCFEEIRLKL